MSSARERRAVASQRRMHGAPAASMAQRGAQAAPPAQSLGPSELVEQVDPVTNERCLVDAKTGQRHPPTRLAPGWERPRVYYNCGAPTESPLALCYEPHVVDGRDTGGNFIVRFVLFTCSELRS